MQLIYSLTDVPEGLKKVDASAARLLICLVNPVGCDDGCIEGLEDGCPEG